jgi:hypothetical protein
MSEYPEDIMKAAKETYEGLPIVYDGWDEDAVIECIAVAILAERNQCVKLLVDRSQDVRRGHVERACYANAVALISRGAA